jgi:hypothetical protein
MNIKKIVFGMRGYIRVPKAALKRRTPRRFAQFKRYVKEQSRKYSGRVNTFAHLREILADGWKFC